MSFRVAPTLALALPRKFAFIKINVFFFTLDAATDVKSV